MKFDDDDITVKIRRQWNDWRIGYAKLSRLSHIHWDRYSGGVNVPCPQYFIHAYIWCNDYEGELAHSCQHGDGPYSIKVCITKVDNNPAVFDKIKEKAGQVLELHLKCLLK